MRPNRVQKSACRAAAAQALGEAAARDVLAETGIDRLPDLLPEGPRDAEALRRELQPFVDLYRAVERRAGRQAALAVARAAIIGSGKVSHAAEGKSEALNLTAPPPPGLQATPADLQRGFALAMAHFACEGELLAYNPSEVRFHVTRCHWCTAMERAGAPELIEFFCETDERFMDDHPTHRLRLYSTIGRGASHCDFHFVPRGGAEGRPASR